MHALYVAVRAAAASSRHATQTQPPRCFYPVTKAGRHVSLFAVGCMMELAIISFAGKEVPEP